MSALVDWHAREALWVAVDAASAAWIDAWNACGRHEGDAATHEARKRFDAAAWAARGLGLRADHEALRPAARGLS